MTKQISFAKLEQEVRPRLRERLNSAESTEDVKKFFSQSVHELLLGILGSGAKLEYEDIRLDPHEKDVYAVSERLRRVEEFDAAWKNSDLPHILRRMAGSAMNRHIRLERHPDKTEARIHPVPDRGGHHTA